MKCKNKLITKTSPRKHLLQILPICQIHLSNIMSPRIQPDHVCTKPVRSRTRAEPHHHRGHASTVREKTKIAKNILFFS